MKYRCTVHGEHFCQSLGLFETEDAAQQAGQDWAVENGLIEVEDGLLDGETMELTECGWEVEEVEGEEPARSRSDAEILAEARSLDDCYRDAARHDAEAFERWLRENPGIEPGEDETEDPVRDGWVGSDGRP